MWPWPHPRSRSKSRSIWTSDSYRNRACWRRWPQPPCGAFCLQFRCSSWRPANSWRHYLTARLKLNKQLRSQHSYSWVVMMMCMCNHTFAFNKGEVSSVSTTSISVILSNDTEQLKSPTTRHVMLHVRQYTPARQQLACSPHDWQHSLNGSLSVCLSYCWICRWNNYEKWTIFGEVTGKNLVLFFFMRPHSSTQWTIKNVTFYFSL